MRRGEQPSLRVGASQSAHRGGGSSEPHDGAARAAHPAAGADTRSGKQACLRGCGSAAPPLGGGSEGRPSIIQLTSVVGESTQGAMPRLGRLDAPGVLHHIMIRGIERRNIFQDDTDREDFLARLATLLPETQTACYAWVLMPNHAHLLLRTGPVPLATLMRRLLTG